MDNWELLGDVGNSVIEKIKKDKKMNKKIHALYLYEKERPSAATINVNEALGDIHIDTTIHVENVYDRSHMLKLNLLEAIELRNELNIAISYVFNKASEKL